MEPILNILVAASEAGPLARASYMGDVVSALPQALMELGVRTSLVIPRYGVIPDNFSQECIKQKVSVPIGDIYKHAALYRTSLNGMPVYLIDMPDYYCHRTGLYRDTKGDYPDNAERFIFFSRAVVEMLPFYEYKPSVVHCNDWQTGLIPLYLKHYQQSHPEYDSTKCLFTVHNLSYQGLFWRFDMHLTGLPWSYFTSDGIEFYGDINLLKAGLLYADAVNTVSPRYCREIQTPEYGCGLEGVLQAMHHKLHGILNGADYQLWSPDNNTIIPATYNGNDLSGKVTCKTVLLEESGFSGQTASPLVSMISPLYSRKGLDLFELIVPVMIRKGIRMILQGSGDRNYVSMFSGMQTQYPDAFRFIHNMDRNATQKILAGSDILLIPSRFEPCGLNQLYAMRFGTIPIVHRTGGLDDTVFDSDTDRNVEQSGFKFSEYSAEALVLAIERALDVYQHAPEWKHIMQTAMKQDFSWYQSAGKYLELYKGILTNA